MEAHFNQSLEAHCNQSLERLDNGNLFSYVLFVLVSASNRHDWRNDDESTSAVKSETQQQTRSRGPSNKQQTPTRGHANKQSGRPTLTVHSRVFWEGPSCAPAVNTCRENFARDVNAIFRRAGVKPSSSNTNANTKHSAVPTPLNHEIASVACFLTPDAINLVLDRSGHSSIARITNCSSPHHHGDKTRQDKTSQVKSSVSPMAPRIGWTDHGHHRVHGCCVRRKTVQNRRCSSQRPFEP